jgi:hypothetical protein
MSKFDDYKFVCFTMGINTDVIESCRNFVENEHNYEWKNMHGKRLQPTNSNDLGYFELRDITDLKQSLELIKDCIFFSAEDYDSLGRSLTKVRLRQLISNPNKHLLRLVLKSYYLFYFDLETVS